MGFCFSCCRRRDKSPEKQPLLRPKSQDVLAPPQSQLDKLADVLAALHVGKLPSQDQLNRAIQLALRSDILNPAAKLGYGTLNNSGKKVVADVRKILDAVLQLGLEKNGAHNSLAQKPQCAISPVKYSESRQSFRQGSWKFSKTVNSL